MFDPHSQNIRHCRTFLRDGPHVHKVDQGTLIAPRSIWRGQCESNDSKKLNDDNSILIIQNLLTPSERIELIQESYTQERPPAKKGGNHNKIEWTRNGKPYVFDPEPHLTKSFASHVKKIGTKVLEQISKKGETEHDLMDSATEYEYGVDMAEGGSIEKMNDTEGEWKHIGFYGLGQTRYLRITKKGARGFINIPLHDNFLVICSGKNFQRDYFHQVDNLPPEHPMGTSMLIKTRFRKPLLSGTKTI